MEWFLNLEKNMHCKKILVFISFILYFNLSTYAQNAPIVAQVNNEPVSLETMIHAINDLPQEVQSQPFINYYEGLLERVIDIKLLAQEGKKLEIQNEPSVKAAIDFVTEKVLMQAFLSKFVQENITEDSLEKSYENFVSDKTSREEIKASHILLETKDDALEVINLLEQGKSFEELAKSKSTGPSGPSGGDLGWFKRGQMVPPFEKVAFLLDSQEITKEPIQTQFGWHVIKVFQKRIPDAPSFDSMKTTLIQDIERRVIAKKVQDLRLDASIEKMSANELQPLLNLPARQ
tara:strand:- start:746 stop:1615 length:870 start_codon:yes stop_codon:yes gene_type:complete